jgi:hypothetical protein
MKKFRGIIGKKADDRMIYPFQFFVFFLITIAIAAGVFIFYSKEADVRGIESKIIANKIVDSISESGYIKDLVFENDFDILKESNLDRKIFVDSQNFYLNLTIYDHNNKKVKSFIEGNKDFEVLSSLPGKNLPILYKEEFYLTDKLDNSKLFKINILVVTNNKGARIK